MSRKYRGSQRRDPHTRTALTQEQRRLRAQRAACAHRWRFSALLPLIGLSVERCLDCNEVRYEAAA